MNTTTVSSPACDEKFQNILGRLGAVENCVVRLGRVVANDAALRTETTATEVALRNEVDALRLDLKKRTSERDTLHESNLELMDQGNTMARTIDALRKDNNRLIAEDNALRAKVVVATTSYEVASAEILALRQKFDAITAENARLRAAVEPGKLPMALQMAAEVNLCTTLVADNNALRKDAETLHKELSALHSRLDDALAQSASLRKERDAAANNITAAYSAVPTEFEDDDLVGSIKEMAKDIVALRAAVSGLPALRNKADAWEECARAVGKGVEWIFDPACGVLCRAGFNYTFQKGSAIEIQLLNGYTQFKKLS
jgi:chromosome segregation ATPase